MYLALNEMVNRSLQGRNPGIDFLRGISILAVVMLHFWMAYQPQIPYQPVIFSFKYWPYLARNGYWGVSIFFVVSGYLITSGTLSRFGELKKVSFKEFYVFRLARILPPILLLIFVAFMINYFLEDERFFYRGELSFWQWLEFIFIQRPHGYWPASVSAGDSLGVMWSLLIEEAFYLFFPLVCFFIRDLRLIVVFLLSVMAYSFWYRSEEENLYNALFTYSACFDLLALGCLVAIFKNRFTEAARWFEKKSMVVISLVAITGIYFYWYCKDIPTWGALAIGSSAALFLLAAGRQSPYQFSGMFGKLMRIMGLYCFEIYLSHIVVAQLLSRHVFFPLDQGSFLAGAADIYFLLTWGITVFVSILVSEFYSEPIRRLIKDTFLKKKKLVKQS